MENCELSSMTTHRAPEALQACRYFGLLISNALRAKGKEDIFRHGQTLDQPLPRIRTIVDRCYLEKSRFDIRGTGYVVDSLEAALWAFETTSSFEEGALEAVNLGDDTDTTGAVFGQIAGAFYGEKGIPKSWLKILAWRERITRLADQLHQLAHSTRS
jgi:ADP-ribosyl-[dinitrogen reductase] hydrolase